MATITEFQHDGRQRVMIEGVKPQVDGGRFAAKRVLGDIVRVEADIFTDGHDSVAAVLLYRMPSSSTWQEVRMEALVNDRWFAEFKATEIGRGSFTIHAWVDHFETWRRDLLKRIKADGDTPVDYLIGADLIEAASTRALGDDAQWLMAQAKALRSESEIQDKRAAATATDLNTIILQYPDRTFATVFDRELPLVIDPLRARFCAWYEFFPRSTAPDAERHGTFTDSLARLEYAVGMGFNIIYLPPIHPIGLQFRKGRNNTMTPDASDVGSPWAIGSPEGGHKSIHPALGTIADFERLVARTKELGAQLALDIAFQVSPDHPYVTEHANWFRARPDGTIQYAENPPKKYQDIYPFDFESVDWEGMWKELKSIFIYWIEQGVRIFRVDNPHTKAFPFWEWAITEIKSQYPDVLFLAEAFTRPKIMYRLAKLGYSMSYTYFPWRNTKEELTTYFTELTKTDLSDYFRASHWPNTPDILTEFLQTGGKAGFTMRFLLAATLSANYGIYGPAFELLEGQPLRQGSEEYRDSEKYQIRNWDVDSPNSLRELIALVNRIRKENPALQNDTSLDFHPIDNEQLICYTKQSGDGADLLLMVVNLDPHHTQAGFIDLPLKSLNIDASRHYQVHDLLTEARYIWNGPRNYVELNPTSVPAHIFSIRRRLRTESDFEYFL